MALTQIPVGELHNLMVDDIKIILAEYRMALEEK